MSAQQLKLVDPEDHAAVDELLTEIERAVDDGFLYDMECALARTAAAAADGAELRRTLD